MHTASGALSGQASITTAKEIMSQFRIASVFLSLVDNNQRTVKEIWKGAKNYYSGHSIRTCSQCLMWLAQRNVVICLDQHKIKNRRYELSKYGVSVYEVGKEGFSHLRHVLRNYYGKEAVFRQEGV